MESGTKTGDDGSGGRNNIKCERCSWMCDNYVLWTMVLDLSTPCSQGGKEGERGNREKFLSD